MLEAFFRAGVAVITKSPFKLNVKAPLNLTLIAGMSQFFAFSITFRWQSQLMRVEKQRKELTVHFLPGRNRRNALQQWIIRRRNYSVTKRIEHYCASRFRSLIGIRTMDHHRMVKRTLSRLQLDSNR